MCNEKLSSCFQDWMFTIITPQHNIIKMQDRTEPCRVLGHHGFTFLCIRFSFLSFNLCILIFVTRFTCITTALWHQLKRNVIFFPQKHTKVSDGQINVWHVFSNITEQASCFHLHLWKRHWKQTVRQHFSQGLMFCFRVFISSGRSARGADGSLNKNVNNRHYQNATCKLSNDLSLFSPKLDNSSGGWGDLTAPLLLVKKKKIL